MDLAQTLVYHGVKYFKAGELYTPGDKPRLLLWPNIIPTLFVADALREEFGPTVVTSGYRGWLHNKEVGGSRDSMHLYFNALDLKPERGTPDQWKQFLMDSGFALWGGVGRYASFIHVDTRKLVFRRPATTWEG